MRLTNQILKMADEILNAVNTEVGDPKEIGTEEFQDQMISFFERQGISYKEFEEAVMSKGMDYVKYLVCEGVVNPEDLLANTEKVNSAVVVGSTMWAEAFQVGMSYVLQRLGYKLEDL
jgi:hypothetical protein